jgi:hypothetical protein
MAKFLDYRRLKTGFIFGVLLFATCVASTSLAASETPEEILARCETMAMEASEMAFNAQLTGDYSTAQLALNLADEAAYLVAKVVALARDTADAQLAWSAYNVCHQVEAAINNVVRAAGHMVSHSSNPEIVHAADMLLDLCKSEKDTNRVTMQTALVPFLDSTERAEAYSNKSKLSKCNPRCDGGSR